MPEFEKSIYFTPRLFLIGHLAKPEEHGEVAKWIVKNESFQINESKFARRWFEIDDNYYYTPLELRVDFLRGLLSSIQPINLEDRNKSEYSIVMRSDQKRTSVNDLKKAPLFQWILQFIFEGTRVDWIETFGTEGLQFRIIDMKSMGEVYSRVNGIKGNGLYNIKLLLASYCMTGIMTNTGKNQYRFSIEWLKIEIERMEPETAVADLKISFFESMALFPDHTLPIDVRHNQLKFGYMEEENYIS